jgi:hypothetical protein
LPDCVSAHALAITTEKQIAANTFRIVAIAAIEILLPGK